MSERLFQIDVLNPTISPLSELIPFLKDTELYRSSGCILKANVTPDSVEFVDLKNSTFHVSCGVNRGVLTLSAHTRGWSEESDHHPDLRATDIVMSSIDHFRQQGLPIVKISDVWVKSQMGNHGTYHDFLTGSIDERAKYREELLYINPLSGVESTWTAHIAHKLGFTHSCIVREGINALVVEFRP